MVDSDGVVDLHSLGRALDDEVRCADDVLRGAEVFHEVTVLRCIVRLEAPDELDARIPKTVDVLVVVAHRHDGELGVPFLQGAAGKGAD
jgi:hypothetical protein